MRRTDGGCRQRPMTHRHMPVPAANARPDWGRLANVDASGSLFGGISGQTDSNGLADSRSGRCKKGGYGSQLQLSTSLVQAWLTMAVLLLQVFPFLVSSASLCCGGGAKGHPTARPPTRAHQGARTQVHFWSCSRRPADEPMTGRRGPGFWPAWARQFGQRRRDLVGLAAEGGERGQHEARLKGSSQREG